MTDNTQPEAREFTMSQYASKDDMIGAMRKCIAELESELEAVGAGGVQALSAAPEIHEPKCPALDGAGCTCAKPDPTIDRAWAQFCGGIGDGLDAPYPGMISAFERYYSQSFADKAWRNEASVWAAAWKAALLAASPTPPAEQPATKETSGGFHVWRDISTAPKDGSRFVATGHNYGLYSEVRHTCVAQWFQGCWMEASDWNETSELKYLTHWMPLPSPPDDVAAPAEQQAAPKAAPGDVLDEALRERDDAEDFIDALLDEVLGHERPEWSSSYGRADALNDVQERMTALHKPAVDKAWDRFQSAITSESGTPPAEQQAQPDECFPGEPKVAVPQGLISAACFAIRKKRDGGKVLEQLRRYSVGDRSQPLAPQQAAPKAAPAVGNSGFDHKTAADFLNGKTVSDEAVRKFVAVSRWAHDERAALSATLLAMHGVLTSREAEIALLKKALLEAEAAPQQEPSRDAKTWCSYVAGMIGCYLKKPDESAEVRAIAGIIERRLWALPAPQPAPAPLSDDTERLEWLLWKLPGDALRYVVGELADTSSGAEFRAAIDAARKQGGRDAG